MENATKKKQLKMPHTFVIVGIIILAALASVLIVGFQADVSLLIPLYAVGVFTSFTLSQVGMVRHHIKLREKNWVLSVLGSGAGAIATGFIDPARIGITGLSDGATTARFALINDPDLFVAASVSSCCADGDPLMIYGGPAIARERLDMGFPSVFGAKATEAVAPVSLRISAAKVRAPILMQLADREFIGGLEAYTSLKAHKKPVDMYVFDGEYHIKWQPAHRLAIYNRNIDWFDFWLLDRRDSNPAKAEQYRMWEALDEQRGSH